MSIIFNRIKKNIYSCINTVFSGGIGSNHILNQSNSLFRKETLARVDKQGNLSPEVSKALVSAPREKVISVTEAAGPSECRGSATLSPKHFQLLQLGWVMQVSSSAHMQSIYAVPKNYFQTSTATASLKKRSPAG